MRQVGRRSVLAAGAASVLTACSGPSSTPATSPAPRHTTSPPATTSTSPGSPAPAELPVVSAWHPDPNDIAPLCKLTAVRRVEAAGNGPRRALQVIDAQYGGLLTDSASVLVVTRSWARRDGRVEPGGHTYDVRLSRVGTTWRVTAIHPSHPGRAARSLSRAAGRMLDNPRVSLPPAARADVASGHVHDSVLTALLALSKQFRIGVSVVRSGHPFYVFGTTRPSDHPPGRAFDTWAINGHAVVDARTPKSLVEDYMHAAADVGSYNVGGPYLLGAAPQWFSDDTHHDHVHAGFLD